MTITSYTVDTTGQVILDQAQPAVKGEMPVFEHDLIPLIIRHLPLLKQLELVETDSWFPSLTRRMIRRTKIDLLHIFPIDVENLTRLDVLIAGKEGMTVDFKGNGNQIDMPAYIQSFDYLLKIVSYTDCTNACITAWFPPGLDLMPLPSSRLHHGIINIKDLYWGFGAPLALFVQLQPEKSVIDTMFANVGNGADVITETIRVHNILPN